MKENLLFWNDLLGIWKIGFLNIWQLCQKKIYFNVLDNTIDKYNNIYHRTIKMKPIDVKFNPYAEYI